MKSRNLFFIFIFLLSITNHITTGPDQSPVNGMLPNLPPNIPQETQELLLDILGSPSNPVYINSTANFTEVHRIIWLLKFSTTGVDFDEFANAGALTNPVELIYGEAENNHTSLVNISSNDDLLSKCNGLIFSDDTLVPNHIIRSTCEFHPYPLLTNETNRLRVVVRDDLTAYEFSATIEGCYTCPEIVVTSTETSNSTITETSSVTTTETSTQNITTTQTSTSTITQNVTTTSTQNVTTTTTVAQFITSNVTETSWTAPPTVTLHEDRLITRTETKIDYSLFFVTLIGIFAFLVYKYYSEPY